MDRTLQSRGPAPTSTRHREVAALAPWFHNLHLPDGLQTAPDHPLGDFPRFKWEQISPHLPGDMTGWTALDIGCNAGYYSFELARRGARVTAIDPDPHYLRQAAWAASEFGLTGGVEFRRMQVYDLAQNPNPTTSSSSWASLSPAPPAAGARPRRGEGRPAAGLPDP